ncbi:MAG TPA: 4'-phosphopantetheinyl transferase superfamily protein [Flavobacteriales bacterium]|nr:4'-phosphopantetheinyl transferase superfamily protein [Flavobacteriales bacterium]
MIGNDIISTNDIDNLKSFSNQRFLNKSFTEKELFYIKKSNCINIALLFWTIKESAYKTMVKLGCKKLFCPIKIEIELKNFQLNQQIFFNLTYKDNLIAVKTLQTPNYIHSISTVDVHELNRTKFRVLKINSKNTEVQSRQIRESFIYNYAKSLALSIDDITIHSDFYTGIPSVSCQGQDCPIDLSFSHDGFHIAYAYSDSSFSVLK